MAGVQLPRLPQIDGYACGKQGSAAREPRRSARELADVPPVTCADGRSLPLVTRTRVKGRRYGLITTIFLRRSRGDDGGIDG
jgi:hypothetical protein